MSLSSLERHSPGWYFHNYIDLARRARTALLALALLAAAPAVSSGQALYMSLLPFEHVDTAGGQILLTVTDLALPGNGSFNLGFTRAYNSKENRWRFGIGGVPLRFVYLLPNSDLSDIDFITIDGETHNAQGATAQTFTREFWRFTKATKTLELPNGLVLTYAHTIANVGGFLTEIRDPFDNVVTLSWQSGTDQLLSVTQQLGGGQSRTITFANWDDDTPTAMTYSGRTWSFNWTPGGRPLLLDEVYPPEPPRWRYWYGDDGSGGTKLRKIRVPNGGVIDYTYGVETFLTPPTSRVVIQTRETTGTAPYGHWDFDWQDSGETLEVVGPRNRVIFTTTEVNGLPVGTSRTVKTLGGATVETETLTHTLVDNPVQQTPALQTRTVVRDGVTYTTTYSYSSSNYGDYGHPNQVQEVGELSRTTTITYKHDFTKYIRGRPLTVTRTIGGQSTGVTYTYDGTTGFLTGQTAATIPVTYTGDGKGNVASVTDARNNTTSFTYEWGVLANTVTPMHTTTRVINSVGTVASETRAGVTTSYTYDNSNRVTAVSSNVPGQTPASISYIMGDGFWIQTLVTRGSESLLTAFDGLGRAVYTIDHTGAQTRAEYDVEGLKTYQSYPYGSGTAEAGVTYNYDAIGRLLWASRPDGALTEYLYGGAEVSISEWIVPGFGRTTIQQWRGFGHPTAARLMGLRDAENVTWSYAYDVAGNLTSVSAPGTPTRTWEYNSKHLLWKEHIPETVGTTVYDYDAVGNVTSKTEASGTVIQYQYDANNRLTAINSPVDADDVSIAYDVFDRPVTLTNSTAQTTFGYDAAGHLATRRDIIAGQIFDQQFEYDAMDNLVEHTYPTGRRVIYVYGTDGRLTFLKTQVGSESEKTLASNFSYHVSGAPSSFQYGNGLTRSQTFDVRQRPVHWVSGPLDLTYGYDYVNNVRSITDARPAYTSWFDYDRLDRLTVVAGNGPTSYSYDPAGNRLTSGTVGFQYDPTTWRLSQLTGGASGSFTYDANGSLLSDPSGATYTYTSLNMAKTTTIGGQTTSYRYGPDGFRTVKVAPSGAERYFIQGPGGLVAEYERVGLALMPVREYIYLGGQLLATAAPDPVTMPAISVSINTPQTGQSFSNGQSITLTATANVPPGTTVARVEYYQGGQLVGQATSAPYSVSWNNLPLAPGQFTFLARLVTTGGAAVASAPVTITIN